MTGLAQIKTFLLRHEGLNLMLSKLYRMLFLNRKSIRGKNNQIIYHNTYAKRCRFHITGSNNRIVFQGTNALSNCCFHIHGNNNEICLDDQVCAQNAYFCVEDDHGKIEVGYKTLMCGKIEIASTEGTTIRIGKRCLFSANIDIRSGDSHSIFNQDGQRINQAEDICIADHVWMGRGVSVLKGAQIANDCVVGAGAIVTKVHAQDHAVLAGIPAKIVKEKISWTHER